MAVPDHLVLAALNSLERQAAVLPEPANVRLRSNPLLSAAGEIDNARLCRLLRNEGADEERSRIARDLHDRMGEALALLGFEMDLVLAQASPDSDAPGTLADDLRRLRGRQREVVQELRNILHDASRNLRRGWTGRGRGPVCRTDDRTDGPALRPRTGCPATPACPAGTRGVSHRPGGHDQCGAPRSSHLREGFVGEAGRLCGTTRAR